MYAKLFRLDEVMNKQVSERQWFSRRKGVLAAVILVPVALLIWRGVSARKVRHVIFISLDTCRADYLSCYGFGKNTTPNIDRLADEGILFANAYSTVPLTMPSHSSMLTGTIPPRHGVRNNHENSLAKSNVTLAEMLGPEGFVSAAVVSSSVLGAKFGLGQGFDMYNDRFENGRSRWHGSERIAAETTRVGLEWLELNKGRKCFLFLHYYDPHRNFEPPEPFKTRFAGNPYAGEIAYTDHHIGKVVKKLKQLGIYDSSLIIIAGDHGEMLGEHGEESHGYYIYSGAVKVPLIFKLPGRRKAVQIEEPVSLIDIVRTVCNLTGVEAPSAVQGEDLGSLFRGAKTFERQNSLYCETWLPEAYKANNLQGVISGQWQYIRSSREELYNLAEDPAQSKNLAVEQRHRARTLRDSLERFVEESVRDANEANFGMKSETMQQLNSLGYVSGAGDEGMVEFDPDMPDAKDLIELHVAGRLVARSIYEKKYKMAESVCMEIFSRWPNHVETYIQMGKIASAVKDYGRAVEYLEKGLLIEPENSKAHTEYAVVLASHGHIGQAIERYERSLRIEPDQTLALNNLAWIRATAADPAYRDPKEAVVLAVRACEITGFSDSSVLDTLACAYAAAGRFGEAVDVAQQAIRRADPVEHQQAILRIQKRLQLFKAHEPYHEEQ